MAETSSTPWRSTIVIGIALVLASFAWWKIAAQGSSQRFVLLVWLSCSSLMIGAILGFLFSSYGEETNTLGKIRDWLIGAATALTVANASSIKGILLIFAAGSGPIEFAYVVGAAICYAGLGFFCMYFARELFWNPLLAAKRAERGRLEGSKEAGQVIQRFLVRLPASVLTGVSDIADVPEVNEAEQEQLKELLYSQDVETFLKQAEDAASKGALDWDIASKCAYITYYRTYFEKDNQGVDKPIEWITRALNMNPLHVDLTMKYAEMLGVQEDYESVAVILEKLALRAEAPILVRQWLGYYLRFLPDRFDDSIHYSKEFLHIFPNDSYSLFNLAYVYAGKYGQELAASRGKEHLKTENREKALASLKEALADQPDMTDKVRDEWTKPGKAFAPFLNDKEFRVIVGLQETNPTAKKNE